MVLPAPHPSFNRPLWLALAIGVWGFVGLPWYALADGHGWLAWSRVWSDEAAGNAWRQAATHGRVWLWGIAAALGLCAWAAAIPPSRTQGRLLVAGAGLGLAGLVLSGLAIGPRGWAWEWPAALWGEWAVTQSGVGWGGALVSAALLCLLGMGLARSGRFRGDLFVASAVVVCMALLGVFIVFPVLKALSAGFLTDEGHWSASAWVARLASQRTAGLSCLVGQGHCGVAWNTLVLGLMVATSTTVLGTALALLAERGGWSMRRPLNGLALLPIITPPFVVGLGLILLFGRAGLVNQFLEWAWGVEPSRWFYGLLGIWVAQTFAFTPIAYMIMRSVVQGVSPSLEEAARVLHASPWRVWRSVTLPLLKPGLVNAFLVGFIESMADFGNPIVVGGAYPVLSTEIFFAIVGAQFDQGKAATLAWILTAMALAVFALQRYWLSRQSFVTVSGKADASLPAPMPNGLRRLVACVAVPWLIFTVVVYAFAFTGGFVKTWGRDWTPTLLHFQSAFSVEWGSHGLMATGTAWKSFFTTVQLAAVAAPLTAGLGLLVAWVVSRASFQGRSVLEFSALLAFAIPGTVLGVSYILAFNVPPIEITGTAMIIVLCFVFRNVPVSVRAGVAALGQLDRSLDEASQMLRASTGQTLRHVVLPLLKPAAVSSLIYGFVRAITTVSAVIFLVTAEYELATTYIIGRVGNGDYGMALAYCTVLMAFMGLTVGVVQRWIGERELGRRPSESSAQRRL